MSQHPITVLHGPNLNLLGTREPEVYGHETLADINQSLQALGESLNAQVVCRQSNAEHELIEAVHALRGNCDGLIINPAAFTHTSVALRDAIAGVNVPFVEVHLSNIHQREPFRQHSYFSDLAKAVICGMGSEGYRAALRYLVKHI